MDEKKVRSIRLDDETNEKFKALCTELGGQSECVNTLINAFELNRSKSILTDMTADINEFESLVNRLVSAYTHALALKQDAETNAKETVERELKAKDEIINRLTTELTSAEQALKNKEAECTEHIKDSDIKLANALKETNTYKNEIAKLAEELNTSKSIIQDKLVIIDGLTARIPENETLQNELKKKNAELSELSNINNNLSSEISKLSAEIKQMKAEAEITAQKHQLELEKAIINAKSEKIEQFEDARKKYEEAREQMLEKKEEYMSMILKNQSNL
ncbi:MAG: hypothetical protein E7510_10445 [Ruminococcus sp.]|nr:hypothetical protein [Ruminococcus sp.]